MPYSYCFNCRLSACKGVYITSVNKTSLGFRNRARRPGASATAFGPHRFSHPTAERTRHRALAGIIGRGRRRTGVSTRAWRIRIRPSATAVPRDPSVPHPNPTRFCYTGTGAASGRHGGPQGRGRFIAVRLHGAGTRPAALRAVSATSMYGSRRTLGFPPRRGHLGTGGPSRRPPSAGCAGRRPAFQAVPAFFTIGGTRFRGPVGRGAGRRPALQAVPALPTV